MVKKLNTDEAIELAQALEQHRALKIVEAVADIGKLFEKSPAFCAGFELACGEIEKRLRTEEWQGCLKPVGENK